MITILGLSLFSLLSVVTDISDSRYLLVEVETSVGTSRMLGQAEDGSNDGKFLIQSSKVGQICLFDKTFQSFILLFISLHISI